MAMENGEWILQGTDTSAYSLDPKESKVLIYAQVRKNFPEAAPETLDAVLGWNQ